MSKMTDEELLAELGGDFSIARGQYPYDVPMSKAVSDTDVCMGCEFMKNLSCSKSEPSPSVFISISVMVKHSTLSCPVGKWANA